MQILRGRLRPLVRALPGLLLCLALAGTAVADTIIFRGNPTRSWNGRLIEDPADFHFKHRANEPGYFEFDRGSNNNRIGLRRDNPNILSIEKNEEYGMEEDLPGAPLGPVGEDPSVALAQPGMPAPGFMPGAVDPSRAAERLEVVSTRDWLYPLDSELPLRPPNVVAPPSAVRTPPNSRAKLGYRQLIYVGLLPGAGLRVNGVARESQTGIYQLDLTVDPGGEIWLNVTDRIRLSDRVRFIVNGLTFETRSTLVNVQATPAGEVVVANFSVNELVVSVQGERLALTNGQEVNASRPASQPGPTTKSRADWDNWEIWTPEKIDFPPEVFAEVELGGDVFSDFSVVRVGEAGDLPKSVPVQPQGTLQIIQQWRQGIVDYISQTGDRPPADRGYEAGLEEVRRQVGGPLLALPTRDNWGNPFVWKILPQGTAYLIDVHSMGPNGRDDFGLGDDL